MNDVRRWITRIQGARSDAEVVRIVQDYISTLASTEIAAQISWKELSDRVGICEAAVDVARAELSFAGDSQSHQKLKELVAVLIAASNRFGQLEA